MQTSTAILLLGGAGALGVGGYFLLRKRSTAPGAGEVFVSGVAGTSGAARVAPLGQISSVDAALRVGNGADDAGALIASGVAAGGGGLAGQTQLQTGLWAFSNKLPVNIQPRIVPAVAVAPAVQPLGTAAASPFNVRAQIGQAVGLATSSLGKLAASSGLQQLAKGDVKGSAIAALTAPVTLGKTAVTTAISTTTAGIKTAASGAASVVHKVFSIF